MHRLKTFAAALALVAVPAQAAEDPGLTLHEGPGTTRQLGVAAQARLTIPLGRTASADTAAPRLSLRAGPSLTRTGPTVSLRDRTRVAPLAELALRPRHSTTLSFAGQPLAASYASPALREAAGPPDGPRQNLSTLGYMAIGVVVVAVVGGLLFIDAVRDASE